MCSGGTGANRYLPLPMAFCETSCFPPLSLTSYVSLAVSIYVLAYFLCWFSVGKCHVRFCLRGFWQMGWGTNDEGKNRHASSVCLSVCVHLCLQWCIGMCLYVSDFVLSHIYATSHASASASQARIEDMPCYFVIYQSRVKEADAIYSSEAFTFKIILCDMFT